HVGKLGRILGGLPRLALFGEVFRNGDLELLDEGGDRVFAELLLLVCCVAGLRAAQPVALHGFGKDDSRSAGVLHGAKISVVDLAAVVPAAMQLDQLLVGVVLYQFQQLGVFAEEFAAEIGPVLGLVGLEVAVHALFHALEQEARVVALKELVPVAAPD